MIRVTVELIPHGIGPAEHLGTAEIVNDGTGTRGAGNYTVRLSRRGQPTSTRRTGRVLAFPRLRRTAWDLLYRALRECVGVRNA